MLFELIEIEDKEEEKILFPYLMNDRKNER